MDLTPPRPALGAVLNRPDVQRAKATAMWSMQCSLAEHRRRFRAMDKLAQAHSGLRIGRPLCVIASELRIIADDIDTAGPELAAAA